MGRHTILKPEITENVVNAIRTGATLEAAAYMGDIHPSTLWDWVAKGEKVLAQNNYTPSVDEQKYADFAERVSRARAEIETLAIGSVIRAGTTGTTYTEKWTDKDGRQHERESIVAPDHRALTWFLERSMWQKYGRRNALELTGKDGGAIQVKSAGETPTDLERFRALKQAMEESNLPLPDVTALSEHYEDVVEGVIVEEEKEA